MNFEFLHIRSCHMTTTPTITPTSNTRMPFLTREKIRATLLAPTQIGKIPLRTQEKTSHVIILAPLPQIGRKPFLTLMKTTTIWATLLVPTQIGTMTLPTQEKTTTIWATLLAPIQIGKMSFPTRVKTTLILLAPLTQIGKMTLRAWEKTTAPIRATLLATRT